MELYSDARFGDASCRDFDDIWVVPGARARVERYSNDVLSF